MLVCGLRPICFQLQSGISNPTTGAGRAAYRSAVVAVDSIVPGLATGLENVEISENSTRHQALFDKSQTDPLARPLRPSSGPGSRREKEETDNHYEIFKTRPHQKTKEVK